MIENGRPVSKATGDPAETNIDRALLTDMKPEDIKTVENWINRNIRPAKSKCPHTSYYLKHYLENDTGVYMTNNQFKDALYLAGYDPVNPEKLNWTWCIHYMGDPFNNSIFVNWAAYNFDFAKVSKFTSQEKAFLNEVKLDDEFPIFADYGIIKNYLYSISACAEAIDTFETVWVKFQKDLPVIRKVRKHNW